MAYNNYGPPPGAYGGRQNSYQNNYSGAPGMAPPPGMGAPPGMDNASSPTTMGGQQFQPPPNMSNMPNFNFNAPVIRLGVGGQDQQGRNSDRSGGQGGGRGSNAEPLGNRGRMGLGASGDGRDRNIERERAAVRESMMALQPPTREEVARTIFIGGIGEGAPDELEIEKLLRCAGKLRRWNRARDADDKDCKFGFAEYEDVESLEAANEIFNDFEVPVFKNGAVVKDAESEEEGGLAGVKTMKLLVVVDQASKEYITEWTAKRKEDDNARQFRIDGCREDLRQCLTALANSGSYAANRMNGDADGDVAMGNVNGGDDFAANADVVNIQLSSTEDELSDIAPELRATVIEEIKAFRDRSNRRDLERMRREDELEQAERQRSSGRINRLASPPPSGAPSGPASAANGIPVGPRDRGPAGAPAGPRGYRGVQMPSDYVNGVAFVGANGNTNGVTLNREDEDSEASDEELERRRQAKRQAELDEQYAAAERRWLNRERTRAAAQSREKEREGKETEVRDRDADAMRQRLGNWDDDEMARDRNELYYQDRVAWNRTRVAFREREDRIDEHDRQQEARENADERRRKAEAMGMADDFMDQMSSELEARGPAAEPTPTGPAGPGLKISLGSAAAKTKAAAASQAPARRAMADVEGLLDDEEDAAAAGLKRPELKPLSDLSTAPTDPEDRAAARQQLAAEIPTDTQALFAFPLKRQHLTDAMISGQIRGFVEKKVVEFLGVQEDLLVETVVEGLKEGKEVREITGEVEGALDEEDAEALLKKVWRVVVYLVEERARGLAD